ncbi:hypothetical protein TRSC58_00870 [Trypanosoma rangeli SC58]|uniref:Uncharacterized protein n=1 Tax=Trypanosoma rangeli SC58 TaxID=429131 RepID=A0A061JB89_TRYRA|nr:hypothetical protein TRSC58_00870 [Trypanosoma rangeli SC58]
MLPREGSRHTPVLSHPYGAETQNEFVPSLVAASVGPSCLERPYAGRCVCDDTHVMGGAGVTPGATLAQPWWRRGVGVPGSSFGFSSPMRPVLPSQLCPASAASPRAARDAVGDSDSHVYHHRGEGVRQRWWVTRDAANSVCMCGAPESDQLATAWYQLNYGLPISTDPVEQPYNTADGTAAPDAPTATTSPARGGAASVPLHAAHSLDDRPSLQEEKNAGVCAELLALRRRVDAVEAICRRDLARDEVRRRAGSAAPATQGPVPEAPITSSPPPTFVEAGAAPATSVTGLLAETPPPLSPPSSSPTRAPEQSDGITLERLMRAVRRARERAKEHERQQLLYSPFSAPEGSCGSASKLHATAGGAAQRSPSKT